MNNLTELIRTEQAKNVLESKKKLQELLAPFREKNHWKDRLCTDVRAELVCFLLTPFIVLLEEEQHPQFLKKLADWEKSTLQASANLQTYEIALLDQLETLNEEFRPAAVTHVTVTLSLGPLPSQKSYQVRFPPNGSNGPTLLEKRSQEESAQQSKRTKTVESEMEAELAELRELVSSLRMEQLERRVDLAIKRWQNCKNGTAQNTSEMQEAAQWLKEGAEKLQGTTQVQALYALAQICICGFGVDVNHERALEYLEKAVELGDQLGKKVTWLAESKHLLGRMYMRNQHQNLERGAALILQAAKRGHAPAQYTMSQLYKRGNGVLQSRVDSMIWLDRSREAYKIQRDALKKQIKSADFGIDIGNKDTQL